MISRVCEEFHCLPADAINAIENDYNGLLFVIMEMRNYAASKQAYEDGQRETELANRPKGPGIDRVVEIAAEIMKEDYEKAKKR